MKKTLLEGKKTHIRGLRNNSVKRKWYHNCVQIAQNQPCRAERYENLWDMQIHLIIAALTFSNIQIFILLLHRNRKATYVWQFLIPSRVHQPGGGSCFQEQINLLSA